MHVLRFGVKSGDKSERGFQRGTDRARTPDDRAQDQGRKVPCHKESGQFQLQGHPVAEQGPDHATGPRGSCASRSSRVLPDARTSTTRTVFAATR